MERDLSWIEKANCRGCDPDLFFPPWRSQGDTGAAIYYDQARPVCDGCVVKAECLELGLEPENRLYGMFGGLTPKERRALRRSVAV